MDWGKAKNILIVSFFLLNIFLGYQVYSRYLGGGPFPSGYLVPSSFEELLSSRNITLESPLPQETPVLSYISGYYVDLLPLFPSTEARTVSGMEKGIQVSFSTPVSYLTNGKIDAPFIEEYTFEKSLTTETVYRYTQVINHRPVFNAALELEIENEKIKGYKQWYIKELNKGLDHRMISALSALRTLVDNGYVRFGETISSITPGFYAQETLGKIQVFVPVWRVVHSGQIHYINGINGAIEGSATLEKK